MSFHLFDIMCVANSFPNVKWQWKSSKLLKPTLHVYCNNLWEWKYVRNYQIICDEFILAFYTHTDDNPTPSISKTTFYVTENIYDWYHTSEHNYLWIYCGYEPPNIFPHYLLTIYFYWILHINSTQIEWDPFWKIIRNPCGPLCL